VWKRPFHDRQLALAAIALTESVLKACEWRPRTGAAEMLA